MARDIYVVVNQDEIDRLSADTTVRDLLLQLAEQRVVPAAQLAAPKRTGQGAAGIAAEPVLDDGEWTAHVSWQRDNFYMYFHERGTVNLPARPFLVPALEGAAS